MEILGYVIDANILFVLLASDGNEDRVLCPGEADHAAKGIADSLDPAGERQRVMHELAKGLVVATDKKLRARSRQRFSPAVLCFGRLGHPSSLPSHGIESSV
jgi:hypothetical protein